MSRGSQLQSSLWIIPVGHPCCSCKLKRVRSRMEAVGLPPCFDVDRLQADWAQYRTMRVC